MGFFTILRSLEEFLYEVMSWLIFFPRTLWQVIRHPARMIDYSDHEQKDTPEDQYTDTLSPPIFLMLSILVSHALQVEFHAEDKQQNNEFAAMLSGSVENLLILQIVLFSIYPLMFAVGLLKRSEIAVDRNTLRAPFFSQCYLAGVFAILVSVGTIMLRAKTQDWQIAGLAFSLVVAVWYVGIQSLWFREHLKTSWPRSVGVAFRTLVKASFINGIFSSLFFA